MGSQPREFEGSQGVQAYSARPRNHADPQLRPTRNQVRPANGEKAGLPKEEARGHCDHLKSLEVLQGQVRANLPKKNPRRHHHPKVGKEVYSCLLAELAEEAQGLHQSAVQYQTYPCHQVCLSTQTKTDQWSYAFCGSEASESLQAKTWHLDCSPDETKLQSDPDSKAHQRKTTA